MTQLRPDLTDAEVDALCEGLRQNAAKVRYLQGLGLIVHARPNGRPLVWRAHAEQVLGGLMPQTVPSAIQPPEPASTNRAALIQLFRPSAA